MRFLCSLPAALTAAGIVLLSLAARPAAAQQKTYVMKISTPTAIALMPRAVGIRGEYDAICACIKHIGESTGPRSAALLF